MNRVSQERAMFAFFSMLSSSLYFINGGQCEIPSVLTFRICLLRRKKHTNPPFFCSVHKKRFLEISFFKNNLEWFAQCSWVIGGLIQMRLIFSLVIKGWFCFVMIHYSLHGHGEERRENAALASSQFLWL